MRPVYSTKSKMGTVVNEQNIFRVWTVDHVKQDQKQVTLLIQISEAEVTQKKTTHGMTNLYESVNEGRAKG